MIPICKVLELKCMINLFKNKLIIVKNHFYMNIKSQGHLKIIKIYKDNLDLLVINIVDFIYFFFLNNNYFSLNLCNQYFVILFIFNKFFLKINFVY